MSEEAIKPDGWVAWHPNQQFMYEHDTFSYWEDDCEQKHKGHLELLRQLISTPNMLGDIESGWRIRPVKLVFLDSDEVKNEKS